MFREVSAWHFISECLNELLISKDREETLQAAVRIALPRFADGCAVFLFNAKEKLELASSLAISDTDGVAVRGAVGKINFTTQLERPAAIESIWKTSDAKLEREISFMAFPLQGVARCLGAICFLQSTEKWIAGSEAMHIGRELAKKIAISLQRFEFE